LDVQHFDIILPINPGARLGRRPVNTPTDSAFKPETGKATICETIHIFLKVAHDTHQVVIITMYYG
jgi:hypothetical protein